jgi:hypothetical protein
MKKLISIAAIVAVCIVATSPAHAKNTKRSPPAAISSI